MFTRCQGCHTVHPVNAALLSRAKGQYRCGRCQKLANALDALFDEWPSAGDQAIERGDPPVLGGVVALEQPLDKAAEGEASDAPADVDGLPGTSSNHGPWLRLAWISLAVVFILSSVLAVGNYFGVIELNRKALDQSLVNMGLREAPPEPPFRDTASIELVSREMLSHPLRPRVLLLNATIVNRAGQPQPYPEIQVKLFNIDNEVISERRFRPTDYLTSTSAMRGGMTPDAYLRFSLEMLDPGDKAVGFELEFF
jgi:predicted Zn finger-like uncharacterized protein